LRAKLNGAEAPKLHRKKLLPKKKSVCHGQTLSQNKYSTGVKPGVTHQRRSMDTCGDSTLTANFWRLLRLRARESANEAVELPRSAEIGLQELDEKA